MRGGVCAGLTQGRVTAGEGFGFYTAYTADGGGGGGRRKPKARAAIDKGVGGNGEDGLGRRTYPASRALGGK